MLDYELHRKLQGFNKTLNNIYKSIPALYEIDGSWDGFNWISVDEKDNNVIAFARKDKGGKELVAIFNFSGYDFEEYRLGVDKGKYKAILCTDDVKFGGRGRLKIKTISTVKKSAHGKENSIRIKLPRLSAIYFVKTV